MIIYITCYIYIYTSHMDSLRFLSIETWNKAPSHIFSSFSSNYLMRDLVVHLAWLGTHAFRSVFERDPSATLLADLSSEVKILQAELHRAHRLIEGYNLAFEREERTNPYQILGLELFILFLAIVTLVLLNPWIWRRRASPPPAPLQVLGNTGGSSDSESGSEDQIPLTWPGTVRGRGGGPVRPSLLGKGHKK